MCLIGVRGGRPTRRTGGRSAPWRPRFRHRLVRLATWKDDLIVHVLDSIHGPDDLKALPAEQLPALAEEIRTFLVDSVSKTGGHLGPNLGVVELTIALHRVFDSPARHDRLRHRPPVLRAQAAHRPARLQQAQEAGRPVGLPEPQRVRARRGRELPRLDRAVLGRRHRQGAPAARRARPAHRGRHRRRRAHRGHGLGGDQQHRHRQGPAPGHRRQRQRPLLRHDHRRAWPTTSPPCAPPAATSGSSTGASPPSRARPWWAARCTARCTG